MTKTVKLTKEEKRAIAEAEYRTKKIAEFRTQFLKDQSRVIFSERLVHDTNNKTAYPMAGLIRDLQNTNERLRRELASARESINEALTNMDSNRESLFWSSNGLTGRNGLDVDRLATERAVQMKAISGMALMLNFRVVEIESKQEREYADRMATYSVVECGSGYGVRRMDGDACDWMTGSVASGEYGWMTAEFGHNGMVYGSLDDAWAALYVAVNGREIR